MHLIRAGYETKYTKTRWTYQSYGAVRDALEIGMIAKNKLGQFSIEYCFYNKLPLFMQQL